MVTTIEIHSIYKKSKMTWSVLRFSYGHCIRFINCFGYSLNFEERNTLESCVFLLVCVFEFRLIKSNGNSSIWPFRRHHCDACQRNVHKPIYYSYFLLPSKVRAQACARATGSFIFIIPSYIRWWISWCCDILRQYRIYKTTSIALIYTFRRMKSSWMAFHKRE